MKTVPVIDISPARSGDADARRTVAKRIGRACEEIGFFLVVGHEVPPALVEQVDAEAREFFYLPQDEKMKIAIEKGKATRGYRQAGISTLARGAQDAPPDLRESFVTGPEPVAGDPYYSQDAAARFFTGNRWPERPAQLRGTFERYYEACTDLAKELMRLFALALAMPEHFFDDKIDRQISALNVNHYPRQKVPPRPGQIRAGAHTDMAA